MAGKIFVICGEDLNKCMNVLPNDVLNVGKIGLYNRVIEEKGFC